MRKMIAGTTNTCLLWHQRRRTLQPAESSLRYLLIISIALFFTVQLYASIHLPTMVATRSSGATSKVEETTSTNATTRHEANKISNGPGTIMMRTLDDHSTMVRIPQFGILIDAGRFHFDVAWLKRQFDFYARLMHISSDSEDGGPLKRNTSTSHRTAMTQQQGSMMTMMVHLRLSDDPMVSLSHYTDAELIDLVSYAQSRHLLIVPELDVPGHAASWTNAVQCPQFTCHKLFGVPLDTRKESTYVELEAYIARIVRIFGRQENFLLHLGGDEVHMGAECLLEAGLLEQQNYTYFEERLREIVVHQHGIREDQVIRWQSTAASTKDPSTSDNRVGGLLHFWHDAPSKKRKTRIPTTSGSPDHNIIVSTGLYWDTVANQLIEPDAYDVYIQARGIVTEGTARAMIATAFEMNSDLYQRRNVPGKLVALAMAASSTEHYPNRSAFAVAYQERCPLGTTVCNLLGLPLDNRTAMETQRLWNVRRQGVCQRLGVPHVTRVSLNAHRVGQ